MGLATECRTYRPSRARGIGGSHRRRAFFPDSVNELEDICTKIAIELKNQYVIGYHSTNVAKDGKWRKLRVKVNPPKGIQHLNVKSKSRYYAPMADAAAAASKN